MFRQIESKLEPDNVADEVDSLNKVFPLDPANLSGPSFDAKSVIVINNFEINAQNLEKLKNIIFQLKTECEGTRPLARLQTDKGAQGFGKKVVILCGPFVDNSADSDLESELPRLAELLKGFHEYLKQSVVVLVPAISEEGFQSIPRKPLHDDFLEMFMDQDSSFFYSFDDQERFLLPLRRTPFGFLYSADSSWCLPATKSSKAPSSRFSALRNN